MYLLHNGPVTFFFEQAEIIQDGSVAKASLKYRNYRVKAFKFKKKDPKPSDLCMSKLKFVVTDHRGLNPRLWQKAGMTCA